MTKVSRIFKLLESNITWYELTLEDLYPYDEVVDFFGIDSEDGSVPFVFSEEESEDEVKELLKSFKIVETVFKNRFMDYELGHINDVPVMNILDCGYVSIGTLKDLKDKL